MKELITHLTPSQYKKMPWKNGVGETEEIAVSPLGASIDSANLIWRLSSATISANAPFSAFPGYNRLLSLVQGKGLLLQSGEKSTLLMPGDIYSFSGEEEIKASLTQGMVRDLGLIYQRGKIKKAEMRVLDFKKAARSFTLSANTALFYVSAGTLNASVYPGEHSYSLQEHDALRIDAAAAKQEVVTLFEPTQKSQLICIEIYT
jgi:uncharacterized protein